MLNQNIQDNQNLKFTGGNSLTGMHKLYHQTMMVNELRGGYGAYELSYAKGESGFSFGGNQMDIRRNSLARDTFVNILNNASDKTNNKILTDEQILLITGQNNANLIADPKSLPQSFLEYMPLINAALSSDYGRATLDSIYGVEIKSKAEHVEKAIQLMQNPAAKQFYNMPLGKTLLFDYHNQFNLELDGPLMKKYVDGQYSGQAKTVAATGEKIVAPIDTYTYEDHHKYIQSTLQWVHAPEQTEARLANVQDLHNNYQNHPEQYVAEEVPVLPTTAPEVDVSKNFALTFDPIKGWIIAKALSFEDFFFHDKQAKLYENPYSFMLKMADKIQPNTFYYDGDMDRLFFTSKTIPSTHFLNPTWVPAYEAIMAEHILVNPMMPFAHMTNVFPIQPQISLHSTQGIFLLWTPFKHEQMGVKTEKLNHFIDLLQDIHHQVDHSAGDNKLHKKISLTDVVSFSDQTIHHYLDGSFDDVLKHQPAAKTYLPATSEAHHENHWHQPISELNPLHQEQHNQSGLV
ncbi:MAG: hypothetical protein ACHQJ6_01975 [Candidatus Berkiellales bacterium]